jgi:hypothetical protein
MLDHVRTQRRTPAALLGLAFALAACGGGGGGSSPSGVGATTATVRGTVTSVSGGLTVNGIAFATSGAVLTSSDAAGPVTLGADDSGSHLRPGMVVTVRGKVDGPGHGEAAEIEFHDQLEGEIEVHRSGEIEVHGVHVSIDDDSSGLDRHGGAARPEDLPAGTRVAISGVADSRGGLRASLVRERDDSPEREVRAYVVSVDGSVIGLAFDPAGAPVLRVDLSGISPAPSFVIGALVEVRTQGAPNASGVYTATGARAEDSLHGEAEDELEVEGVVTAADASGFTVAGQRVVTSAATTVVGGTLTDVVVGVKLEAEGKLQADGTLLARVLKLRAAVRIEARADAVDPAGGTLTLIGITARVTPSTELRGLPDLSSLAAGTRVEVRGIPSADGTSVDALRIDVQGGGPDDRAFLRGVVSAEAPLSELTILGIALDLSSAEFRGIGDVALTAQAFFDAVTPGQTVVKVRWRPYPASTSAPVDEAEIDNDG